MLRRLMIILIALCFREGSFAQVAECEVGTSSAKADYSRGILRLYIFGMADSFTFGKVIKSEYGIEAVYGGCIGDQKWDCYSKFMSERIKERYGNDIFDKVAKKSRLLDSTGMGDRQAEFPGGAEALNKFVYCHLDLARAKYTENKKGRVYMQFEIDTAGRPVGIKVMKTPNEDYGSEATRILSLMPDWTTATQNGKTIKQQWNLPIVFDRDWKDKHCR